MSATNKPLKTDLGGKPINQHYNPVADEHQPTEGANGAPNTRIKDGENEAFGARNDSPATSYNQTATLISLLKYMLQLLDSPWAKGDKGDKGDTGEALTPKGVVADSASLPSSGNTENDFWITSDDGHGWVWDGSQWIDVGQIQGDPGADGREVELQKSATHIQWRYVGEVGWVNLVTLSELKGDQGDPGNSAEFQVTATHIQWRLQGAPTWTDLIALSELEGEKGDAGDQVELRTDSGFIQWRLTGGTWANLIEIATLKGDQGNPGKSVELQKNATHVQWRLVGDPDWIDLIPLADLVGDQGDPGDEVSLQVSGGYIQWRLGTGSWTNLIAVADLKGDQGDPGLNAWTPVMAVESDGSRRVFKVADWIGGGGTKPAVNVYIGASGYTANIAEAIDVRGLPGADGSGSGDMSKSTYDTDDDGKVDAAEVADSVDWSGVQNKPSTFTPSTHTHSDATPSAAGFMSAADKSKLDNVEANADVTDSQNVGASIHGASSKSTPVDADTLPLIDSAASNVLKKLTWSNLKATLKLYFDTLYSALGHNHDERYYTETETDSLLSGKQDSLGFTPENSANKNQPSGYAGLDSGGKINPSQLPAIALTEVFQATNEVEHLAISAQEGDVVVRTDESKTYIHNGGTSGTMSDYTELANSTGGVTSFNSRTGAVTPQSGDYDLSEIDETGTYKRFTATEQSKLSNIEANADVTDAGNVGSSIHGSSGKTTPVDADTLALIDSAASNVLKKVTWANLKATLKTYFDTLYNLTTFASAGETVDSSVTNKVIAPSTAKLLIPESLYVFQYDSSSTNTNNSVPDGMFRLNHATPGSATVIRFGSNDKNGKSMYAPHWIMAGGGSNGAFIARRRVTDNAWTYILQTAFATQGSNQFTSTQSAGGFSGISNGELIVFEFGQKGLGESIASQAQAEAGTQAYGLMTPLRTAQAIAALGGGGPIIKAKFSGQTINSTSYVTVSGLEITSGLKNSTTYMVRVKIASFFQISGSGDVEFYVRFNITNKLSGSNVTCSGLLFNRTSGNDLVMVGFGIENGASSTPGGSFTINSGAADRRVPIELVVLFTTAASGTPQVAFQMSAASASSGVTEFTQTLECLEVS